MEILGDKNIKGLHISDAIQGIDFRKGTHLAIGDGTVDFDKLIKRFSGIHNIYGALEIKSTNAGIENSLLNLNKIYTL